MVRRAPAATRTRSFSRSELSIARGSSIAPREPIGTDVLKGPDLPRGHSSALSARSPSTRNFCSARHMEAAACSCAELPDGKAVTTWAASSDPATHPAHVIVRLKESGLGCQWLAGQWNELGALIERGEGWEAPERFRAFKLLGIHAIDTFMTAELATLLSGVPGARSQGGQPRGRGLESSRARRFLACTRRSISAGDPTRDGDGSNRSATTLARDRRSRDIEPRGSRAATRKKGGEHGRAVLYLLAVDDSREGNLLTRYEHSLNHLLVQHVNELFESPCREPEERRADPRYYLRLRPPGSNGLSSRTIRPLSTIPTAGAIGTMARICVTWATPPRNGPRCETKPRSPWSRCRSCAKRTQRGRGGGVESRQRRGRNGLLAGKAEQGARRGKEDPG